MSIFRLYPGFKLSFELKNARKNLFLSACFCWDARVFSRETDQKLISRGNNGFGDSYLDYTFCHSIVFKLQAILHNAAGAVQSHSSKGVGSCYMIGRGMKSCLLGHMTRLFFCSEV